MTSTTKKLTRAEKSELTRRNLLKAAVEVVGERGYGDASVTSITSRANIAQGTFYNYFDSKQDVLDQLLPELGEVLLHHLGAQVGNATFLEREERSLRAYFDFIQRNPGFYRILLEAQVYSPDSYARHVRNLTRNYIAALRKNKANGYLQAYSDEDFEVLAAILLGARVQLMVQYCFRDGRVRAIPERVIEVFMKFLASGFGGAGTDPDPASAMREAVPGSWYSGEVVAAGQGQLHVRYEIDALSGQARAHSPDRAVQELVADLLGRAVKQAAPPGARVRSTSTVLYARDLPSRVEASCRIEAIDREEAALEFVLFEAGSAADSRLANGQALLRANGLTHLTGA